GVADEVTLAGAELTSPEGDVGHLHARASERRVALHLGAGARRGLGGCARGTHTQAEPRQRSCLQELAAAQPMIVFRAAHDTALRLVITRQPYREPATLSSRTGWRTLRPRTSVSYRWH